MHSIAIQRGELREQGKACKELGVLYRFRGNLEKAEHFLQKSLAIAQNIDDMSLLAEVSNALGVIYGIKCRFEKAMSLMRESLALQKN